MSGKGTDNKKTALCLCQRTEISVVPPSFAPSSRKEPQRVNIPLRNNGRTRRSLCRSGSRGEAPRSCSSVAHGPLFSEGGSLCHSVPHTLLFTAVILINLHFTIFSVLLSTDTGKKLAKYCRKKPLKTVFYVLLKFCR